MPVAAAATERANAKVNTVDVLTTNNCAPIATVTTAKTVDGLTQ